jgi:hypothetical protein
MVFMRCILDAVRLPAMPRHCPSDVSLMPRRRFHFLGPHTMWFVPGFHYNHGGQHDG